MLLTLHIQLANITDPPVWRRVTVPAQFTFHNLHRVIQAAFGWEDCHMYQFSEKGYGSSEIISQPYEDDWSKVKDSDKTKLSQVLDTVKQKYTYIYDFGDDWTHKITVEKIEDTKASKADCISGIGACPPEDCGGPWGYRALKEILNNPKHQEHEERKEWLGLDEEEGWDAAFFDLEKARKAVSKI